MIERLTFNWLCNSRRIIEKTKLTFSLQQETVFNKFYPRKLKILETTTHTQKKRIFPLKTTNQDNFVNLTKRFPGNSALFYLLLSRTGS